MHKTTDEGNSDVNHAALNEQNDKWGLVPIETCRLVQMALFCMQKPQMKAGNNGD